MANTAPLVRRLFTYYVLVAPSASGKDAVKQAALALGDGLVGSIGRYTTREIREGDDYSRVTPQQIEEWKRTGEILSIVEPYGTPYVTLRRDQDRVLEARPAIGHCTLANALEFRNKGYDVRLSRLLVVNRRPDQLPARVLAREAEDKKRKAEHDEKVYEGIDLVNDFSKEQPTNFRDAWGKQLPLGSVLAGCDWLRDISRQEGWDTRFIEKAERQALQDAGVG